jgi:hypothetical protein
MAQCNVKLRGNCDTTFHCFCWIGKLSDKFLPIFYSVALVRERTIPTERQPLVGEISANLLRIVGCRVVSAADPYDRNLGFLDWRLCGLGRQVHRSEFDSWRYYIFSEVVGLKQGPLSLVSTTEELLGRISSGFGVENRENASGNP